MNWKLGEDLSMQDGIFRSFSLDDLALAARNTREIVEANSEEEFRLGLIRAFRKMVHDELEDAEYIINNNIPELYEEIKPQTPAPLKNDPHFTEEEIEKLAYDIYNFLLRHGMWIDTAIYFNGKRLTTSGKDKNGRGVYRYNGEPFLEESIDPRDYFDYVADPHIISMSFEGPVYDMLNYGGWENTQKEFDKLFSSRGLYYELGNAWNLTARRIVEWTI